MRMRTNRCWSWLAPLVLAGTSAASAGVAPVDDACFKQVFQKRGGDGTWTVRRCEKDETLRYRIMYRAAQAGAAAADITIRDIESIVDVGYRIVGPATLLVDAAAERGGRAYLLHPVDGSTALSVAALRYTSKDEETLAVRLEGRRIRASTSDGAQVFQIGANGTLARAGR
jgi:hypothetical protein